MADLEGLRAAIACAAEVDQGQVTDLRPTSGGDVSRAVRAVVAGRPCFVKHLDPPVPGLLATEAAGLAWIDGPVRTPQVVAVADPADVPVLVLAHIDSGLPAADHDEQLGRGLAALHARGADGFGAPWPGFIARLPQPNEPTPDWATFLAERRLRPTAEIAVDQGHLDPGALAALDGLITRLPDRLGPPEPPARLHGDLWGGNAMVDADGRPVLIDPAAYGGHREVDLAMMRLFGGFSSAVFAAYQEARPLADGHAERVALHQLHPLLVHAAMFAGGYGRRALDVIRRYR